MIGGWAFRDAAKTRLVHVIAMRVVPHEISVSEKADSEQLRIISIAGVRL
jgi:hypothetical protein